MNIQSREFSKQNANFYLQSAKFVDLINITLSIVEILHPILHMYIQVQNLRDNRSHSPLVSQFCFRFFISVIVQTQYTQFMMLLLSDK